MHAIASATDVTGAMGVGGPAGMATLYGSQVARPGGRAGGAPRNLGTGWGVAARTAVRVEAADGARWWGPRGVRIGCELYGFGCGGGAGAIPGNGADCVDSIDRRP